MRDSRFFSALGLAFGLVLVSGCVTEPGGGDATRQGVAGVASLDSAITSRVDALFSDYDTRETPGCSLGIARAGELVYARGYGMANLEHDAPLSSQSVFRIGSTSKQFTAAAILLLEQEGKVALDDDIRDYLPELNDFGEPVTIRQLIHHTSGYRDYLTLMDLAGRRDDDYYSDEELVQMLARQRDLNFEPGTEHLYSNSGYFLLSQIVLRVSGESLRDYAAETIFEPLGMNDTHFHDDHHEIVPLRAYGYAPTEGGGYEISMTTLPMTGDGGVFTTVEDLARWDANFYEPRVGGPELVERMQEVGVLDSGEPLEYASGLRISEYRGLRSVSHGGAFVGFRAEMIRFPDERATIICLCNRADANPSALARRVADIYLEDRLEPSAPASGADAQDADEEREEAPELELTPQQLAAYTGDYYCEELDVVYRIRSTDDGLRLGMGQWIERDLRVTEPNLLRTGPLQLRLERTGDRVSGFLLDAGRVKNLRFVRR